MKKNQDQFSNIISNYRFPQYMLDSQIDQWLLNQYDVYEMGDYSGVVEFIEDRIETYADILFTDQMWVGSEDKLNRNKKIVKWAGFNPNDYNPQVITEIQIVRQGFDEEMQSIIDKWKKDPKY